MPETLYPTVAEAGAAAHTETLLGAWLGSAALVYCRDEQDAMLAVNPAFARKLGRGAAEVVGRPIGSLMHPEDVPGQEAARDQLRFPPHKAVRESRWLTPQGWRWISWEEQLISGAAPMVRAIGHDITRQRMAEEQYYKLSRAVEQSPVAMAITDADGNVQYVNYKFTESTGYTLEQIIERKIQVLRDIHTDEREFQEFMQTVRSGQEWRGECVHQRPDGKKVWESVHVSCLRNSAGEVTNLLCLREDITGRRELEEQLRQAQKMESVGTLAGGIAHDFNNLIAIINGYADLAQMMPGDNALLQKCVLEIKKASTRASGLVRQILTFSRKADVKFAAVDLNQLLRELASLLGETFPRNITFSLLPAAQLPLLHADSNQLQQIILNLCVNARDAMPDGGAITLSTAVADPASLPPTLRRDRAYACLVVRDCGTGIPPEVRARIFEPFFTTKGAQQGTGLGLAVVYGIVASHEGAIEVDSTPGVGTAFSIFLPLAETVEAVADLSKATDFPEGRGSIMIVEDEAPLRMLLQSALTSKGYQVSLAADGQSAIEQLAFGRLPVDAVLLDLNMPGISGFEAYRAIHAARPEIKVIVLTGHLTTETRTAFEELGMRHFLIKPYALDELGRHLRELLEDKKMP